MIPADDSTPMHDVPVSDPVPPEPPTAERITAGAAVEPEAPSAPAPPALTLSRAVDRSPNQGADDPGRAALHAEPVAALPHPDALEPAPATPSPAPTDARTATPKEPARPGTEPDEAVMPGRASTSATHPLPLAQRDAGSRADVVVSRVLADRPAPRFPGLVDHPSAPDHLVDRTAGDEGEAGRPSRPGLAAPTVQRAIRTAVRPEPPPTLQRLPGLSTLPGMVRDRPALPPGMPRLPQPEARVPAGGHGPLNSPPSLPGGGLPAPNAPGMPVTTFEAAPEPAGLPMPLATARGLVAAVSSATPPDRGAQSLTDGIPYPPSTADTPADGPAQTAAVPPSAPAAVAPQPADAPTGSDGAATPGAPASPQQIDELARRLYDPLASRLRAELLLDRERRGLRTDAW